MSPWVGFDGESFPGTASRRPFGEAGLVFERDGFVGLGEDDPGPVAVVLGDREAIRLDERMFELVSSSGVVVRRGRCEPAPLRQLLRDACEAHDLTVIDCGTLSRKADQTAAAAATHVAWIMTATQHGLDRARRVLEEARPPAAPELIVARRDARQSSVPIRDLRTLAAGRRAPLVLIPHLNGLDTRDVDRAYEAAQVSTQAILGALTRQLPKAAQ